MRLSPLTLPQLFTDGDNDGGDLAVVELPVGSSSKEWSVALDDWIHTHCHYFTKLI